MKDAGLPILEMRRFPFVYRDWAVRASGIIATMMRKRRPKIRPSRGFLRLLQANRASQNLTFVRLGNIAK